MILYSALLPRMLLSYEKGIRYLLFSQNIKDGKRILASDEVTHVPWENAEKLSELRQKI